METKRLGTGLHDLDFLLDGGFAAPGLHVYGGRDPLTRMALTASVIARSRRSIEETQGRRPRCLWVTWTDDRKAGSKATDLGEAIANPGAWGRNRRVPQIVVDDGETAPTHGPIGGELRSIVMAPTRHKPLDFIVVDEIEHLRLPATLEQASPEEYADAIGTQFDLLAQATGAAVFLGTGLIPGEDAPTLASFGRSEALAARADSTVALWRLVDEACEAGRALPMRPGAERVGELLARVRRPDSKWTLALPMDVDPMNGTLTDTATAPPARS